MNILQYSYKKLFQTFIGYRRAVFFKLHFKTVDFDQKIIANSMF